MFKPETLKPPKFAPVGPPPGDAVCSTPDLSVAEVTLPKQRVSVPE